MRLPTVTTNPLLATALSTVGGAHAQQASVAGQVQPRDPGGLLVPASDTLTPVPPTVFDGSVMTNAGAESSRLGGFRLAWLAAVRVRIDRHRCPDPARQPG